MSNYLKKTKRLNIMIIIVIMIIMSGYTTISVKKEVKKRLISLMTKEDEFSPFLSKLMDKWEKNHD